MKHRIKYRITNKKRFILFSILLFFVFLSSIFGFKVNARDSNTHLQAIYVNKNDTLWSISKKYYGNSMDIRLYIDKVIEINELESVIIKPGQLLYVPIFSSSSIKE